MNRLTWRTLGLALSLATLCSCGGSAAPSTAGPGPVATGGDLPFGAAVYAIAPGVASALPPGVPGYGITANAGGSYRVVWTGQGGAERRFTGSIWTPGSFTTLTPGCGGACPLEPGDVVDGPFAVRGGMRLDFDTTAFDSVDGIDFTVDTEPVYFDLLIDGHPVETLVFFPATGNGDVVSHPQSMPFALQMQ